MKTARCKITEIKDELLEHVETTIHKAAPSLGSKRFQSSYCAKVRA